MHGEKLGYQPAQICTGRVSFSGLGLLHAQAGLVQPLLGLLESEATKSRQEKELFLGRPWRASPAGASKDSEILVPPNKSPLSVLSFKITPSSELFILNYYLTFVFS